MGTHRVMEASDTKIVLRHNNYTNPDGSKDPQETITIEHPTRLQSWYTDANGKRLEVGDVVVVNYSNSSTGSTADETYYS